MLNMKSKRGCFGIWCFRSNGTYKSSRDNLYDLYEAAQQGKTISAYINSSPRCFCVRVSTFFCETC